MPAATLGRTPELLGTRPNRVVLDMDIPDGSRFAVLHTIRRANLSTRDIVSSATKDEATLAAVASHRPGSILPSRLPPPCRRSHGTEGPAPPCPSADEPTIQDRYFAPRNTLTSPNPR